MGWLQPWAVAAAAVTLWVSNPPSTCHPQDGRAGQGSAAAVTAGAAQCTLGTVLPTPPQRRLWGSLINLHSSPHLLLQLVAVGYRLVWRWRLRAIPLVRPMPFFFGHLK